MLDSRKVFFAVLTLDFLEHLSGPVKWVLSYKHLHSGSENIPLPEHSAVVAFKDHPTAFQPELERVFRTIL